MSENQTYKSQEKMDAKSRPLGTTELSWCKGVSSGTGIVLLAIQLSKEPTDISLLQNSLHKLQNTHPILLSKLQKNHNTNTLSFTTQPNSHLQVKSFDVPTTSKLLQTLKNPSNASVSPFHMILEHELNNNAWTDTSRPSGVIFCNLYALPGNEWAVMIRLHGAVCDRSTGIGFLRELIELVNEEKEGGGTERGIDNKEEVNMGIEDLVPRGKAKKGLWAHGMDTLGYSMNSFKLTNLKFKDVKWPRCTQVVRLKLNKEDTQRILTGCKLRDIKLCGALAAAGVIAAHFSKRRPNPSPKKYGVLTLTDCRSTLEPPLSGHNFGYYHSNILNTLVVRGENLWELAATSYKAFANSKKCNKHFSDLSNLNFLMCKAIENPSLTVSSSQRTALISVFEDTVIDDSNQMQRHFGVKDCFGCASVHGVGPSVAIFDTIRDGQLTCTCVYPSPLHSREQMQELVDNMKRVLVDGANYYDKLEGDHMEQ